MEARFFLDDTPKAARFAWFKRKEVGASPTGASREDDAAGTTLSSGAEEEPAGAGALTAVSISSSCFESDEKRGVLSKKAHNVVWRDRGNDFAFGRATTGAISKVVP